MTAESKAETPQGESRLIGFKGFNPEIPAGEVRETIKRIFDHMYDGRITPGFFLDFRNTNVRNVVISAKVDSERPAKDQVELTDNERELEELRSRHFEYSETSAPRYLIQPLGVLPPRVDTPEFE